MAIDEANTAKLILDCLWGRSVLHVAVGARAFEDHGDALSFEYGAGSSCHIAYARPYTYDITLKNQGVEQSFDGVALDDIRTLFENITGVAVVLKG